MVKESIGRFALHIRLAGEDENLHGLVCGGKRLVN
jgi:hypothetical protein